MRQLSVSRPGCLVMLSSLSSALWMLRRIEGGGQQLRWQLWSSRHCPWWKEGTARELKDVGVMFAMKEYCAVTTPHWEPFIRHNDFTILWSRFLIWKVCTEWSLIWWSPIIPIVHWAVIPDVRITITILCHDVTLPPMMELLTEFSGCTVVAGGWASRWLCFTELQVSWDSQSPLTPSVLRPCHTSLPLPPPSLQTLL